MEIEDTLRVSLHKLGGRVEERHPEPHQQRGSRYAPEGGAPAPSHRRCSPRCDSLRACGPRTLRILRVC